jgi:hypothetical protein
MESQVRTAIELEHICQVVILGSGYTTLPYRCTAQHVEVSASPALPARCQPGSKHGMPA